jgi:hypothetical protein
MQELKVMTTAESAGATPRKSETTFEEMLKAIRVSLSDLACSDDEQDGEDEEDDDEDTVLSKLSDDDEPGWVMDRISKTVQHCIESFRQKQMRYDELTQPDWRDSDKKIREGDMKYRTGELKVPARVKRQIDTTTATPSGTTYGEHMPTLEIVSGHCNEAAVIS